MKTSKLLYLTNGINGLGDLVGVLSIKATSLAVKLDYTAHVIGVNQQTRVFLQN